MNTGQKAEAGVMLTSICAFSLGESMEGTTLEPGTIVEHRYIIRRFIAAGGVAQVYAATHRITAREVALKMPRTDGARDPLVHDRLIREGHAVARARHPGVVEIVDAGEHAGAPYLVFE